MCVTNNYVTEFFIAKVVIKRHACSNFKLITASTSYPSLPLLLANYILSSEKEKNTKKDGGKFSNFGDD